MNEKVIITSDSTCDLSSELKARYHIETVPLYIIMNGTSYRDGLDISPDDIYRFVEQNKKLPTSSAATVADYQDFFQKFISEGNTVVHIGLGSKFSASVNNAAIAAKELNGVYVVDSQNLSTGTGLLVLAAADLRNQGLAAAEIAHEVQKLVGQTRASFVIDRLDYLYKGGRCSALAALGANLLNLKPLIEVKDGAMGVGKKYRGKIEQVMPQYAKQRLEAFPKIRSNRIFITHSGTSAENVNAVKKAVEAYGRFDEILVTRAGCVISNHCGYNTLGVLFITE